MGARSEWEPAPLALPLPGRGPRCTAIELATSRPRIFSLSPRGTSGERAGERGNLLLTPNANCKQDGPPLPSPLLPRREERETISLLSSRSPLTSTAVGPEQTRAQT